MSTDIDSIKRKLLIKYPTFGSVIANLEFQKSIDIATAGTLDRSSAASDVYKRQFV